MKRPFSFPRVEGSASRQAHADMPGGTYEREAGRSGFFGPASHFYHRHPPTSWSAFEGPLQPRAFDTAKLGQANDSAAADPASPWDSPVLLENSSVEVRRWHLSGNMPDLARNADGDQLLFLHAGTAELFCDYGHLSLTEGDYLVLPRGTTWRLEASGALEALMVEATGTSYGLPDRGMLGPHAQFDEGILDTPSINERFLAQQSDGKHGEKEHRVRIKARGEVSTMTFPFNPLDAVGWKGNLAPVRLNWRDIRPIISPRYHLPPSVHTTFLADRFVVCTFCPRPLESDPNALRLPFYHNNDDYDEVLFYHAGQFMSRDFITPGMITLHPSGFTHGPHPKAWAAAEKNIGVETNEVAVMIDTRDPLNVTEAATSVEWTGYVDSWRDE